MKVKKGTIAYFCNDSLTFRIVFLSYLTIPIVLTTWIIAIVM